MSKEPQSTLKQAEAKVPGEILFLDVTGPFPPIGGSQFDNRIVD